MSEPIAISQARSLPLRIRVSLWMWCGAALGLPVDDLVAAIDQQLNAAKRGLAGKLIETAICAPDMNAYIERFNESIEEECLDHIILTEDHLRDTVIASLRHYHEQRPHQGIGNVNIGPWTVGSGEIVCDESLHGLLKSFRRAA